MNNYEEEKYVTKEYLLARGFEQYNEPQSEEIFEMPFENNDDSFNFREKRYDRRMVVVIFSKYMGSNKEHENFYHKEVYVQEDAGCGFILIPFPWWDLPIEYFESVYYGIRGHKPKTTKDNG